MPIGDRTSIEISKSKDPETGLEVEKITADNCNSFYPYFTQNLLGADNDYILINCDKSGFWEHYILSFKESTMIQITESKLENPARSCHDAKNGLTYFWVGNNLMQASLDGKNQDCIYSVPEGFSPSILDISSCGAYVSFVYVENISKSTDTGKIYSSMLETLFQRPRSVLIQVDVKNKTSHAVYGEQEWFSHVCIHPKEPNIIMFCHEGTWELVQRLWIANSNTHEVWPIVKQKKHFERSGHEYFTNTGHILTQYAIRDDINSDDWRHANILTNYKDEEKEIFWYDGVQPAHVQTSYQSNYRLVGDCGDRTDWKNKNAENYITSIELKEGKSSMTNLCRHNTSWVDQNSHPHPIFTRDDKQILFNSDQGGFNNIYRVPYQS
ncbi:MAG: hypothetical protein COA79_18440 [Planctomycetota bacterium]|nr:MAG: hypothetical protein COA79_18440 [Planctomycetota bacterium]